MDSNDFNKQFISKAKTLLQDKGYSVKTSHLYDVFAQLAGYKNWHVASKKDVKFDKVMIKNAVSKIDIKNNKLNEFLKTTFTDINTSREMDFDFFDKTKPAWNYSITGQTGSGKTVLLKKLLMTEKIKNKDSKIVLITSNGLDEYKNLLLINNGLGISINKDYPKVNIFNCADYEKMPNDYKMNDIVLFIVKETKTEKNFEELKEIMIHYYEHYNYIGFNKNFFDSYGLIFNDYNALEKKLILNEFEYIPNESKMMFIVETLKIISKYENSTNDLINLVKDTYNKCNNNNKKVVIEDLILYGLEESGKFNKLFFCLKDYTKNGKYPIFDTNDSVALNNDFIIIDFYGCIFNKNIRDIFYHIFTYKALQKLYFEENKRKIMIYDDVESIIKENDFFKRAYIENIRTSRRQGLCTVFSTMSFGDLNFYDGKAVLSNIQTNIICKPIPSDIGLLTTNYSIPKQTLDHLGVNLMGDKKNHHFIEVSNNKIKEYINNLNCEEFIFYCYAPSDQKKIDSYLKNPEYSLDEIILLIRSKQNYNDNKV